MLPPTLWVQQGPKFGIWGPLEPKAVLLLVSSPAEAGKGESSRERGKQGDLRSFFLVLKDSFVCLFVFSHSRDGVGLREVTGLGWSCQPWH